MESFSRYLAHGERTGLLTGIKISRSAPKINHLLFADDCLLFCKANETQVHKLLDAITQFSQCSGQLINFSKSAVYFSSNTIPDDCQVISGTLQVRSLNISDEKYLGLPFFIGRNKRIPFSTLCDKMGYRFSKWSGKNISEAGRLVMVRNVSSAIPIHHMTSFKLPDTTINKMEGAQQKYWRQKDSCKGNHVISWKRTQKPKEEGGLEFCDLKVFNRDLLAKTAWKLCSDSVSMMTKYLKAKYYPDDDLFNLKKKSSTIWSWRSISLELNFVLKHSYWCLGNGKKILLWKHRWIKDLHEPPVPKRGCSTSHQFKYVHQLFSADSMSWNLNTLHDLFEVSVINLILKISIHSNQEDRLVWLLERNNYFCKVCLQQDDGRAAQLQYC
ncbi:uncharacterized protein LOC113273242 [Papaver somniferum]|uniref:uncharacterized protein LOC113273242 n=1 Tax=Papaver somniferum TaxID=3469 RepID=UPI000E6FE628|nr:uncharacterized protein LOC113273242 [Papaver somniferum]